MAEAAVYVDRPDVDNFVAGTLGTIAIRVFILPPKPKDDFQNFAERLFQLPDQRGNA